MTKKTQKASGSADSDRTEDNAAENTETAEHAGQMDDTEGQL